MSEEENTVIPKVIKKVIEDEMKESYMAYSMSVIVGRALPDIRDGLKPVHRRIMFAMHDLGMFHNKPFKKSARIVGEVLGKYHPHGDTAVYDSMVRMAQPFSLRYPLIQGQGNFGSVDGDSAASMRYTEARLSKVSEEILEDIDKDTVDFIPNFDGSLEEPSFLPCKLPNLLINGSSGIAVGMATNIPPHNLTEVCEGTIKLIDEPECDFEELVSIVKGPDFPTGGTIVGRSGIRSALAKGRGKVRIKANTFIEEKNNRKKIIVNEIPYMVNKSQLLIQIAACVKDKRILGISDLRDESDREGMRIVIELKQNANEQVVLNQLFKHTRLQDTFGIIMLSIVNNEPKVLNLRSMLKHFINHRKNVVTRRTQYELRIAQEREHILRGVVIALDDIDEIIQKIKKSKTVKEASEMLQSDYSLSEKQSKAILEMRLQKLSSLEQQKVRDELTELENRINALKAILADEQKILDIIKSELNEIKEKYGDERKTAIDEAEDEDMEDEDLIKEEEMVITLTNEGYIKRLPVATYRAQRRGGQGVKAATTKDEDFVEELFVASTHAYLLIFTDKGKVYWKKVYKIPEASRIAKGLPIINLIEKEQDEKVMTVIPVRHFEKGKFLFFATRKGTVKRTSLDYFSKPRRGGIIALGLNDDDALITVKMTDDKQKIILATKNGRAVKFKETDIRSMGRTATGVRGIRVKEKDELVGMIVANDENTLLTITNKGYGKQTKIADYRLINRGGGGVINIKCTDKNGHVVSIKTIEDDEDLLIISKNGVAIRTNASAISTIGRNTQGVRVMKLKETDSVVAVAKCAKEDVEDIVESDLNPDKPDQVISVKKTVQPTEESDYESLVETVEPVQEEVMEVDEIPIKKPEEAVEEVDEPIKEEVKEPVQEEVTEKSSEEVVDEPVKEVVEEAVDEPVADSVKEEVKEPVKEEVVVEEPKKPEEDNASDSEPSIKDLQKRAEASGKSPVVDQEEVDDAVKKIQAGKVIKKNPFLKRIFGK